MEDEVCLALQKHLEETSELPPDDVKSLRKADAESQTTVVALKSPQSLTDLKTEVLTIWRLDVRVQIARNVTTTASLPRKPTP
ncbi:hypothetical protein TKK_0018243 [Trichogramma kaykai]